MLRALSTSLTAPDSEGAGEDARSALKKYYSRMRNIADFHDIYPLVLDLQRTLPRTFGTVAPSAL